MYSITEAREELDCVLHNLIDDAHFDEVLNGSLSLWDWRRTYHHLIPDNINYNCGCCRMVFWSEDWCDYVFKIDLERSSYKYSANEAKLYQKAVEEGLSKYFAWCAQVYNNGITQIYAMAYCDIDEELMSSEIYEHFFPRVCDELGYDPDNLTNREKEEVLREMDNIGDSDSVEEYLYSYYGFKEMDKLFSFLEKRCVNDIHAGNIGWLDGAIVLTDYAGYGHDLEV